jgi:uncharacterized membrane protein SpoIIM required for sporulation
MVIWFAASFIVGHTTAEAVVSEVRSDPSIGPEAAWCRPILHPAIKYRRSELGDPRLLRLILAVFLHNAWAAGMILYVGGLFVFVPPLSVFTYGWLCGALLEQGGYQILLHRTIPHGLVELPVILLIGSIATLLSSRFYGGVRTNLKRSLLTLLRETSITYAACLPALLLAAALEVYGTRILWG